MTVVLIIYTAALAVLNGIRIFDSTYWFDEMFSIKLIRMPVPELIQATADDVHPPLYYLILKGIIHFVGESGPALHAVSLLPYLIVLLLALTVIRKWFGKSTSFLFVTFASLLATSIRFNVEIRMYSWASLFVLVSYLALYAIFCRNRLEYYAIFIMASLAAAYTHYYALIAVAFFYLVLMLYALIARREMLGRVAVSWLLTALGYLRWLLVLFETFGRTASDWWLNWVPKYSSSLPAIFEGKYDWQLFYIFAAVLVVTVAKETSEVAGLKATATSEVTSAKLAFILAGAASVFGTIAVGVGVSRLIRPMYFERYIYTAAVCAWLIVSIGLSELRIRGVAPLTIALTLFVCFCGYFNYTKLYREDAADAAMTEASVKCIREWSDPMDTPVLTDQNTDIRIMAFFPHYVRERLDLADGAFTEELEKGKEYCLVASAQLEADEIADLKSKGISCTEVRPDMFKDDPDRGAFLGDLNTWIYILKEDVKTGE